MMRFRVFSVIALSVFLLASTTASVAAPAGKKNTGNKVNAQNKNKANTQAKKNSNSQNQAQHLLKAEQDLVAAEAALVSQNVRKAEADVANALRQIRAAIQHHGQNHMGQSSGSGLSGLAHRTQQQHHHSTLQRAETELRAAERQLHAGNIAKASKEIQAAGKSIQTAIASHNRLNRI